MKTSVKKITLLFIATVISSFALSCSSSDDGGGGGSAAEGTITAKVDGTSVTTLEMVTFATQVGTVLQMQGNTGGTSSKAFVFNLMGFEGVGTYKIGGDDLEFLAANASYVETEVDLSNPMAPETNTWFAPYTDEEVGEIKVSEYVEGDYIKGTFHFKAKRTEGDDIKNITNGSFNVNF